MLNTLREAILASFETKAVCRYYVKRCSLALVCLVSEIRTVQVIGGCGRVDLVLPLLRLFLAATAVLHLPDVAVK